MKKKAFEKSFKTTSFKSDMIEGIDLDKDSRMDSSVIIDETLCRASGKLKILNPD